MEMVLLMPLVFTMAFLPIQAGVWFHARHVVTAAAQEGARAARVATQDPGAATEAGRARALGFVATVGGATVLEPSVELGRSETTVEVVVTGKSMAVLPGLTLPVEGRAVSPVERFVAP